MKPEMGRRASSSVSFVLVLLSAACATDHDGGEIGTARQAIVGGSASDATQDATVMLFHLDPTGPRRLR